MSASFSICLLVYLRFSHAHFLPLPCSPLSYLSPLSRRRPHPKRAPAGGDVRHLTVLAGIGLPGQGRPVQCVSEVPSRFPVLQHHSEGRGTRTAGACHQPVPVYAHPRHLFQLQWCVCTETRSVVCCVLCGVCGAVCGSSTSSTLSPILTQTIFSWPWQVATARAPGRTMFASTAPPAPSSGPTWCWRRLGPGPRSQSFCRTYPGTSGVPWWLAGPTPSRSPVMGVRRMFDWLCGVKFVVRCS